ncbi:MAG: carboxypeptidase regulatory-like domain-containing protein [Terracidiphilus sp.]
MSFKLRLFVLVSLPLLLIAFHQPAAAQTGVLRGEVVDPSGAVVPKAQIKLLHRSEIKQTQSSAEGRYVIQTEAPRTYTIKVTAKGFAPLTIEGISLAAGRVKELDLPLEIAADHENVTVVAQANRVGVSPDQNSGSLVFKGTDLNALSDNPDELQAELQQLAGAAAGPNGGQIYIDGFAGGQLPPKSSILEIRVNQNPFSSEYDSIGYGRIEILTKPGSEKLHGSLASYGNTSATNSSNPLVSQQPDYNLYSYSGFISGPLGKNASFFFSGFYLKKQSQNTVDAVNPQNTAVNITEAVPNPFNLKVFNPRIDVQVGKHMLTFRDYYHNSAESGAGVGALNLPQQAMNTRDIENTFQFGDTFIVGPRLLNELHLQWRHVRTNQTPSSLLPTIIVSGAFVDGGNNAGVLQDHGEVFELQDYATATAGNHTLRFGIRARANLDANLSTADSNGTYIFSSVAAYQANQPSQYSAAVINDPVARTLVLDGAAFFQDDWRVKPNFMLGLGVRYEDQNWIHDHKSWAPRLALAWSPGRPSSSPAKTVIRAGYGWFYDRFTVPNAFSAYGGAPYIVQSLHDNRVNQQSYVVTNPPFYNPNAPAPPSTITSSSSTVPSYHSVDQHFHAALNMQAGAGVDQQLTSKWTANITYLFTQGVHQYLSNNVTAPAFNADTYTVTGATPTVYNYQFQSGGVFKQHQVVFTSSVQTRRFVLNGTYTFNIAKSDIQGVYSFPSIAQNPGLDYGRATFGVRHRGTLMSSYTAPWGFVFSSLLAAQSGTPYNLTTGYDLTGNNQFNSRPAYGVCGAPGVVSTRYGCLDTNPAGKGERIVPFGVGLGPANALLDLRVSKTFGIGPRMQSETGGDTLSGGDDVGERGIGSGGAAIKLNAGAPRRYSLTFVAAASNALNIVNLSPPNGVLISPIFGKSQSLADGAFQNPTPGNRAIIFQMNLSF